MDISVFGKFSKVWINYKISIDDFVNGYIPKKKKTFKVDYESCNAMDLCETNRYSYSRRHVELNVTVYSPL